MNPLSTYPTIEVDGVVYGPAQIRAMVKDTQLLDSLEAWVRKEASPCHRLVLHEDWEDGIWWARVDAALTGMDGLAVEDGGPHRSVRTAIKAAIKAPSPSRTSHFRP